MQILKDNYGKVILGISLLCLVITLVVLKGGVPDAHQFANSNDLSEMLITQGDSGLVYPKEIQLGHVTLKDHAQNEWRHTESAGFTFGRYIYCPTASCGRLNKFSAKVCYYCGVDLGLSSEEKAMAFLEKQKFQDGDEDGIINGLEDLYDFMDKANPYDAFLDQDGDGFVNIDEITGGKSIDEQVEMLKSGKQFVYNPQLAKSHPPLSNLLRIKSMNQAREMGVTLKSVNEVEKDKKTWEVAFNKISKSGRLQTIFKKIGETFTTNNGMIFEITGIQKTTKEHYVKSTNSNRKISTYMVEAKTTDGDIYHIKSKLFEKQGSKVIQFIYINKPFYRSLVPIKVVMNEKFILTVGDKGQILDKVEYILVGIKKDAVVIEEQKTHTKIEIKKLSNADKKYLTKRALSEKNK